MIKITYNDKQILDLDYHAYDVEAVVVRTPLGNSVRVEIPVRDDAEIELSLVPRPADNLERLNYLKRGVLEQEMIDRQKKDKDVEDSVSNTPVTVSPDEETISEESELHETQEDDSEEEKTDSLPGSLNLGKDDDDDNEKDDK